MTGQDTPWLPKLIGQERYEYFMALAGGIHAQADALHRYDVRLRDALRPELENVELMLRNRYHGTMLALRPGDPLWLIDPALPVRDALRRHYSGVLRDLDAGAISSSNAISSLHFGFWRQLTASSLEKTLWVPYLHLAFTAGTDRTSVHERVERIARLRNRVMHYEPVLRQPIRDLHDDMLWLYDRVLPQLGVERRELSLVPVHLGLFGTE